MTNPIHNISTSNLAFDNEMVATSRNVSAEERESGEYRVTQSGLSETEARGNANVVYRNGSYVSSEWSEHRDDDLLTMPDGFQLTVAAAKAAGMYAGPADEGEDAELRQEQHSVEQDHEGAQQTPENPKLALPLEVDTLRSAFEMQLGQEGVDLFGQAASAVIDNGGLDEDLATEISQKLGMGRETAHSLAKKSIGNLTAAVGEALNSDGQGQQRVAFLINAQRRGDHRAQSLVSEGFKKHLSGDMTKEGWNDLYEKVFNQWNGK